MSPCLSVIIACSRASSDTTWSLDTAPNHHGECDTLLHGEGISTIYIIYYLHYLLSTNTSPACVEAPNSRTKASNFCTLLFKLRSPSVVCEVQTMTRNRRIVFCSVNSIRNIDDVQTIMTPSRVTLYTFTFFGTIIYPFLLYIIIDSSIKTFPTTTLPIQAK